MSWRAITESDLLTRMSGPELEAFREAALGDTQGDPVSSVITQITNTVRGYIAACDRNTIGAAGAIPETLLGTALDLILIEIQTRAAGILIDPEEIRRQKMDRAERLLRDVAACRFAIEQPESGDETEEVFGGNSPAVTEPTRIFDRTSQEGI